MQRVLDADRGHRVASFNKSAVGKKPFLDQALGQDSRSPEIRCHRDFRDQFDALCHSFLRPISRTISIVRAQRGGWICEAPNRVVAMGLMPAILRILRLKALTPCAPYRNRYSSVGIPIVTMTRADRPLSRPRGRPPLLLSSRNSPRAICSI